MKKYVSCLFGSYLICGCLFFPTNTLAFSGPAYTAKAGGSKQTSQESKSGGTSDRNTAVGVIIAGSVGVALMRTFKKDGPGTGVHAHQQFIYRYRVEPQAFKRDILRQRGPHYSWVKHQWLNVGGLDELSFDCGVEVWRPTLKNLFAEAKRQPSDANIQAIAEKLESYRSMATTGTNNSPCVLRRAYVTYPKNFKRALLKQQGPVYEWLKKRFVSVKVNEGQAFACQLRQRREALATEWQRLANKEEKRRALVRLQTLINQAHSAATSSPTSSCR